MGTGVYLGVGAVPSQYLYKPAAGQGHTVPWDSEALAGRALPPGQWSSLYPHLEHYSSQVFTSCRPAAP